MAARKTARQQRSKHNLQQGFSLIELMLVVGIIGMLVALGSSKFEVMRVRASQLEAKTALNQLYTHAHAFHTESGTFAISTTFLVARPIGGATVDCNDPTYCNLQNDLGYRIRDCRKRSYDIWYTSTDQSSFRGLAREINASSTTDACIPGRSVFHRCSSTTWDIWSIDQGKNFNHDSDPNDPNNPGGACD